MSRWQQRAEELLYDGESVSETVDLGSASVVVTSHRVLAFTPEFDGENFQQADRPNVEGVETGALARNNEKLLGRGLRVGIVGIVLVVAGFLLDFDSIVGDTDLSGGETGGQLGIGGVLETTQRLLDLVAQLDYLMLVFGMLALGLAAVFLGVYWVVRDPTLVIRVAGDEPDIHVPRPEDAAGARADLARAITPDFDDEVPDDPLAESSADGKVSSFFDRLR